MRENPLISSFSLHPLPINYSEFAFARSPTLSGEYGINIVLVLFSESLATVS